MPCRACMYLIEMFDLPVDFCGVDFAKDLHSTSLLKLNPIHSLPCMGVRSGNEENGVNGSEAIISYLLVKFNHKVSDDFWPDNVLQQAKIMEKMHFINSVVYRATVYQYAYPCMGLMSECQYDLCKRDFALKQVETWCSESGDYLAGSSMSVADLYLAALDMACHMTQAPKFSNLPWRWCTSIREFPMIDKTLQLLKQHPAIHRVNTTPLGENCCDAHTWNQYVAVELSLRICPERDVILYMMTVMVWFTRASLPTPVSTKRNLTR